MKQPKFVTLKLEAIAGGGQALGTLEDGRKCFVWGGLPGEYVTVQITKKKAHFVEGIVADILQHSPERITPIEPEHYLSTSPWQIMTLAAEQYYKSQLIHDAFALHHLDIMPPEVYCDNVIYGYRNKVEFSWYSEQNLPVSGSRPNIDPERSPDRAASAATGEEAGEDTLDLAFYRRGSKGKIVVNGTSLAQPEINRLARAIRNLLRQKLIRARQLKTLLIRCNQQGDCVWQLYVKDDQLADTITADEASTLPAQGGEIIYSDPRSPISRITKRLASFGSTTLTDRLLGVPFHYACEGFFQVNLPVYERVLQDIKRWREQPQPAQHSDMAAGETARGDTNIPTLDLYSGVGSIGLTVGGPQVTLVESNEYAVNEMKRNITSLGHNNAQAILAPSEKVLDFITSGQIVIVDPPRAGLHAKVIARLLETTPPRIIYLSCNPVTQARDVALLSERYIIRHYQGYNFFPRTPHIECLAILDRTT